jgi:hypothetical protein
MKIRNAQPLSSTWATAPLADSAPRFENHLRSQSINFRASSERLTHKFINLRIMLRLHAAMA